MSSQNPQSVKCLCISYLLVKQVYGLQSDFGYCINIYNVVKYLIAIYP